MLDNQVIIDPVIPVKNRHKTGYFRPMTDMVGRITRFSLAVYHAVNPGIDQAEGSQHQIMHACNPLARHRNGHFRQQQVVIDQSRAVSHFDKDIRIEHGTGCLRDSIRALVIVHQVLGNPGSLCLPVTPHTHNTVMDMISPDGHVYGCMDLDPGSFRTAQLLGITDIMDMAVFNQREYSTHPADNAGLFTVVDVTAAYNMMADILLQPAVVLPAADGIPFHLCGAFHMPGSKIHIIFRIPVLSERDSATAAVADLTVFNHPAFAPVRPYHPILIGCGRCPGCCSFCNFKSAYRNIVHTGFVRQKAVPADSDFNLFLIGILTPEVCEENRFVPFLF